MLGRSLWLPWRAAWQWMPNSSTGLWVPDCHPDERCDNGLTHRPKRAQGATRSDGRVRCPHRATERGKHEIANGALGDVEQHIAALGFLAKGNRLLRGGGISRAAGFGGGGLWPRAR